jgi:hypothetical protein
MAHTKNVNGLTYIYRYDPVEKKEVYCGPYTPERFQEIQLYELTVKQMQEIEEDRPAKEREEDEASMDEEVLYPSDPRTREWAANPTKYDVIGIDTKVGLVKKRIVELEEELKEVRAELKEYDGDEELIQNLVEREKNLRLQLKRAQFLKKYPNSSSLLVLDRDHLKKVVEGKKHYPLRIGREADGFAQFGIPPRHVYDIGVRYFNGSIQNFGAAASYSRNSEFHLSGQLTVPFFERKRPPTREDKMTIRHEIGHHVHLNVLLRNDDLKEFHTEWNDKVHPISLKMNRQGTSSIQTFGDSPYETFAERYATYVSGEMASTTHDYRQRFEELKGKDDLTKSEKRERKRLKEIVNSSDKVMDYFKRTFEAIEEMDLTEQ